MGDLARWRNLRMDFDSRDNAIAPASGRRGIERGQGDAEISRRGPGSFSARPRSPEPFAKYTCGDRNGVVWSSKDFLVCAERPLKGKLMDAMIDPSKAPSDRLIFADQPLVCRVEAAWDHLGVENALAQNRRNPGAKAEILGVGGGHAVYLGAGSPLSQAQGLGLNGPVSDDELARMERFFKDRVTPTQIEVASLADATLLTRLGQRGYLIMEQTHSLVAPLTPRMDLEASSYRSSGKPDVRQVDAAELEGWVDMLLRAFFDEPELPPPMLREGALAMASVPGVTAWVASVDGQPAGGGSLMIHGKLALICGDGTLARFRQRGVQSALLQARLAHAQAAGCDLAAICTQPGSGSQRNAERQGFQVVYARTMMVRH
jgi:hypothetical protein